MRKKNQCLMKGQHCKCWLFGLFAVCAIAFLAVCALGYVVSSRIQAKADMMELVTKNIREGLDIPGSYELVKSEQPDSAFGVYWFTDDEQDLIAQSVLDAIEDLYAADTTDASDLSRYKIYAPVLQRASLLMMDMKNKGAFSGWKVKVCYSFNSSDGERYTFTRWTFFDESGSQILGKLDLPGMVPDWWSEQL